MSQYEPHARDDRKRGAQQEARKTITQQQQMQDRQVQPSQLNV